MINKFKIDLQPGSLTVQVACEHRVLPELVVTSHTEYIHKL